MNLEQEIRKIEATKGYFIFKKVPEEVIDINLLERALLLLEKATKITGREYVFKHFQQLGLPGVIDLVPKEDTIDSQVCFIIGSYDKSYFERRIRELKGREY